MGSGASKFNDTDIASPKPEYVATNKRLRAVPDHLIDDCRTDIKTLNLSNNYIADIKEDIVELKGLRYVNLSRNRLTWISYEFFELPNLTYIDLSDNSLTSVPGIGIARKLQHLDISKNQFSKLWGDVFKLPKLAKFLAADNRLSFIPHDISKLSKLQVLDWSRNGVVSVEQNTVAQLPISVHTLKLCADLTTKPVLTVGITESIVTRLKALRHLDLRNNHLDVDVPPEGKGILHTVAVLTRLVFLNVEGNDIRDVPDAFCKLACLSTCILTNNAIDNLSPAPFRGLSKLRDFHLDRNAISDIADVPFDKMALCHLSAKNNKIRHLPKQVEQPSLESLHLDFNDLTDLTHIDFGKMKKLKKLSLKSNHINNLPDSLFSARYLEELDLEGNSISDIPENIHLEKLKTLNLARNRLECVPQRLSRMKTLEHINLSGNKIKDTREDAGSDDGVRVKSGVNDGGDDDGDGNIGPVDSMKLKDVNLKDNNIVHIPPVCFSCEHLVDLDMGGNNVKVIPEQIKELKKLQSLKLDGNQLIVVPAHVFQHPTLQELNVSRNQIHTVRADKTECKGKQNLQTLDVSGNCLRSLPKAIENVKSLKRVNVSDNQLYFLPSALVKLEEKIGTEVEIGGNLLRDVPDAVKTTKLGEMRRKLRETPHLSSIARGKIFLLGSKGAGKATLMKRLKRLRDRQSGRLGSEDGRGSEVNNNEDPGGQGEKGQPDQVTTSSDRIVVSGGEGTSRKDEEPASDNTQQDIPVTTNGRNPGNGVKAAMNTGGESDTSSGTVAFMDRAIWPVTDNIDAELTYCGGSGSVQSVYPLFYTANSLYIITVNLQRYPSEGFQACIAMWIKDVVVSIGGEIIVTIVGTHAHKLDAETVRETCSNISKELQKLFSELKQRQHKDLLLFSSPTEVIVVGKAKNGMKVCKDKICQLLLDKDKRLLPASTTSLDRNGSTPNIQKMLELERELLETRDDDDQLKRVRLTLSEFEGIGRSVGLQEGDIQGVIAYMKRIGVVQYYDWIPSLRDYVFHNLDFLKDILQAIFEKGHSDFLDANSFPPGYRGTKFAIVNETFESKAVLSEDVIRECVLGHLELDPDVMSLVFDVLTGFKICYEVDPEGNEGSFLHSEGINADERSPRVLRFPGYLQKGMSVPVKFVPLFEARVEFPWFCPSRLMSVLVCTVHANVREEWKDGFLASFSGVSMVVSEHKGASKSLSIKTAMSVDMESTYRVLNEQFVQKLRDCMRSTWPSLTYSIAFKVICPEDVGCRHQLNALQHNWKPFPRDSDDMKAIFEECKHRKEEIAAHVVARRAMTSALEIINSKLDPARWKELAPHLGIPREKVRAIDKQESVPQKDKLLQLLQKWKDQRQTPAFVKQQVDKMVNTLKVIGETSLAEEVEQLDTESFDFTDTTHS